MLLPSTKEEHSLASNPLSRVIAFSDPIALLKAAIKTKMKLRDRSLAPPRNFFTPGARPATASAAAPRSQATSPMLPLSLSLSLRAPLALRMPPGHCGSAAQTTARTPVVATRPAKDERVLQDALGLIDSPLPGASWHTDALTAASFFVSSRLFLTGGSC